MQADIEIVELTVERHVDLADDSLFRGRSVQADRPRNVVFLERRLDGQGRTNRSCP